MQPKGREMDLLNLAQFAVVGGAAVAVVGAVVATIRDFPGFDFWGWIEAEVGRDLRPRPCAGASAGAVR